MDMGVDTQFSKDSIKYMLHRNSFMIKKTFYDPDVKEKVICIFQAYSNIL